MGWERELNSMRSNLLLFLSSSVVERSAVNRLGFLKKYARNESKGNDNNENAPNRSWTHCPSTLGAMVAQGASLKTSENTFRHTTGAFARPGHAQTSLGAIQRIAPDFSDEF
uniref:Uncharacterized protein n=1 Tax=Solanum tuberosum TaxID=4113 RepID=M1CTY6_SOLTU